jgi:protein gp37
VSETTKIPWANSTVNPWIGCTKVSPGCAKCYAERQHKRMPFGELWGPNAERHVTSDAYWQQPLKWNAEAEKSGIRRRVFCGSMCDVMEDRGELENVRRRLYRTIMETPYLNWLLLTKRPENLRELLPLGWSWEPRPNVWLMTTVENADYLWRADELRRVPAVVHGLSIEPLLGPLPYLHKHLEGIEWVIVGAESGPKARPMDEDWVREIRDQAVSAGVPFFYKQRIEGGRKIELPELDGKVWAQIPEVGRG